MFHPPLTRNAFGLPSMQSAEQAVYSKIEAALDEKRRFRDDAGALGYVGGEYTKKSAGDRLEYEKAKAETQQDKGYTRAEDFVMATTALRRTALSP
jgi:hypothetical protein